MSTTEHSRVAPSALHMTVPCPGSLSLQAGVPEQPDTDEIAEGKAAHHVASEYLRGRPLPVGDAFTLNGRAWTVDDDMAEGAEIWADAMGPGCIVEEPVPVRRIHSECWGTPDGWKFTPALDGAPARLVVGDYKYGHRYVDPFENLQLAAYAIGVLTQLGIEAGDSKTTVELVIVQPRAFHRGGPVQRWTTTPAGMYELMQRVRAAVALALAPNPPTQTGTHCKDCKARAVCGTLRASAAGVVDLSGAADPQELDTVAAATELRILDEAAARLEARRTGLAAQVESELRAGRAVPGWKLEPGQSRLEWAADVTVAEIDALGALIGASLRRDETPKTCLVTPTQAIKHKVPEAVVLQYALRRPAGVKLAQDTDVAARKIFGKV